MSIRARSEAGDRSDCHVGVSEHAEERHPSTLHRMSHVKGFLCAVNLNLGLSAFRNY